MVAKGKRLTRRRSPRRATRSGDVAAAKQNKIMEVRSASQIPALESLLSKGPMTLVLVFADWCPACHRFMKGLWKPMCKEQEGSSTPPASMNRVAVREDLVGKTSLAGAQYKYLPSLMLVGTDKRPAVFESPEGKTNAMPTPRTLDELKQISNATPNVSSTSIEDPSNTQHPENLSPLEPNDMESDEIPRPLNNSMNQKGGCGCMMRGGAAVGAAQSGGGSCSACALQAQLGGGLYSSLMAVVRGAIPATTLAVAASGMKKSHAQRAKRAKRETRRKQRA